ncbi:Toluene efflux pump outer membrane protein TtgI precursor [Rubripirellula amarantea]|uniref:Toluene efflux pump outer membrane protein TtgI n=1 Tax=Rubripirellula amarantea TaxID=2527999 RepID=A0A5C5WM32_9BACT|nr:TolC family protein [Rubripirellula amarantea]TWT51141.1 Toluene efflux pump outer membrane protein TtgI precursor [Rubripirellula amarantea]
MSRNPTTNSTIKSRRRIYFAAVLCGTLLTNAGCKIPGLRHAQCGPAMPQSYQWNNGAPYGTSQENAISADAVKPSTAGQDSSKLPTESSTRQVTEVASPHSGTRSTSLASLIHEASYLSPVTQSGGADGVFHEDSIHSSASSDEAPSNDIATANSSSSTIGDDDSVAMSNSFAIGLIDTEIGPSSFPTAAMPYENSAQLPHAVFYSDPYLLSLITETITGNQELKILSEEIRIACNEAYARSGEYRPFVSLGASAGFEKSGRHTREGAVEDQLEVADGRAFPDPLGDFGVGANVSWELDIWKKLRNSQRAAAMRYLGSQEGRTYIVTRVVAEVAERYYELLALDGRMQNLNATIEIQQQSLKVAEAKKEAGRGTELAVQRFQAEVQKNVSERSLIAQEIVEVENRINFLAGRYPQPVDRIPVEFIDLNLNTLGAGVPSELLQYRADIREAERQVAAAGLDVKVARARFYPSLSLTAGLGWNAFSTGYLFRTPESLVYGMAGELVGPLINRRAIQADYRTANAEQLQAIYNYQQTVLEAHIEVVNQISKVENYRRSVEDKKRQLESLQASVDAANKLFQNARAEYVEVLLAQREMMEAKMDLIDTKQEQLSAIVNAYQALGGGGF